MRNYIIKLGLLALLAGVLSACNAVTEGRPEVEPDWVADPVFKRPVDEEVSWVSSSFSKSRLHPVLNEYRPHLGVDLAANAGTPIYATAPGRIVVIGRDPNLGIYIAINHGAEVVSVYGHMQEIGAGMEHGLRVFPTTIIGHVGSTGRSTGPHLHFEIWMDGQAVDPWPLISDDLGEGAETLAEPISMDDLIAKQSQNTATPGEPVTKDASLGGLLPPALAAMLCQDGCASLQ